mgnify:CR=1 FL=1
MSGHQPLFIKVYFNVVQIILAIIIVTAIISTPFIKETCILCGDNVCPYNKNDRLRRMSLVEHILDVVPDAHFMCVCTYLEFREEI